MAEIDVLQNVWRKALGKPEGVTIPCKTRGEAIRLRMALYRVAKAARQPGASVDDKLRQAVVECGIGLSGPDNATLTVANKANSQMIQSVLAALGEVDNKSAEDLLIQESQVRLLQKLAEPPAGTAPDQPAVRSTPYYTR